MRGLLAGLLLVVFAVPAFADEQAVVDAFMTRARLLANDDAQRDPMLAELRAGNDAAVRQAVDKAIANYVEQAVPRSQGPRDAFLAVLEKTVAREDASFLSDLFIAGINTAVDSNGVLFGLARALDPIAYRVHEDPAAALAAANGPSDAWRASRADAAALALGHLPSIRTVPDNVATDIRAAEQWLNERFGALLVDFEQRERSAAGGVGLRRDLGRLLYSMTTRNANGGLEVLDRLAEIGAELAAAGADLSPSAPGADPDAELATYLRLKDAIRAVLAGREGAQRFRGEVLPTDILSPDDFLSLPAAGYVLDDVGSQRAHGALTHRLQWYAVIDAFEENPGNWYHTPLELYTTIGAFDRDLVEQNTTRRFGFERQGSLWAAVFDQGASTPADLATLRQPDNLLGLLDPGRRATLHGQLASPALVADFDRFADTLVEVDRLRQARSRGLHVEAQAEFDRQRSIWRYIRGRGETEVFGLSRDELGALLARNPEAAREDLFIRDYARQRSDTLVQARSEDNRLLPILAESNNAALARDANSVALAVVRADWDDSLRTAEPPHPAGGPARAGAVADHDVAAVERGRAPVGGFDEKYADPEEPPFPGDDAFVSADDEDDRALEIGESLPDVPDHDGFETADERTESDDDADVEDRRPERRAEPAGL